MKTLKIAADLALPLDAATQTLAFIARKGAGKTYTAGKLVELLLDAGVQVVVLDTVGNWYGLRLGQDGKASGLDVPVLGGLRGDIPLDAAGGGLIADIIVDTGRSMVLDASQFSKADRQRFAAAFGERLWLRKKGERDPAPIHLVIEESQLIVPQLVTPDTAKMVGVYEEIIRLGRNYGIGVSMITQRPQSVNKEVLNQTECLFVGQINGAQERDALKKWITHQGMDTHLIDELPTLKIGTFYVWSPQWLGTLQKVHILPKNTLDASATPTHHGGARVARVLKPLDLTALEAQMSATIEKAKADDPKELRRQLAAKDKELKRIEADVKMARTSLQTVETPALTDADRDLLRKLILVLEDRRERASTMIRAADATVASIVSGAVADYINTVRSVGVETGAELEKALGRAGLQKVLEKLGRITALGNNSGIISTGKHPEEFSGNRRNPNVRRENTELSRRGEFSCLDLSAIPAIQGDRRLVDANGRLKKHVRGILTVLAQYKRKLDRGAILRLANYSPSGDISTAFAGLQEYGLIESMAGAIVVTDVGLAILGPFDPLPEGPALRAELLREGGRLSKHERALLAVFFEAYPSAITRREAIERAGYKPSGDISVALAKFVTVGWVTEERGALRASEDFFS